MNTLIINVAARELAVEAADRAGWELCFIQGPGDIGRGAVLARSHKAASRLTQDEVWEERLVWGPTDEMACARVLEVLRGQQAGRQT